MKRRNFVLGAGLITASQFSNLSSASDLKINTDWSTATPIPINIQELYPAIHNGRLYVAGGIAAKLGVPYFTNRCFSYDPGLDLWRNEADLPEDRHHAALVSANQRLFLVGGFNGSLGNTWVMRNSVHELVDNQWTLIGELPKAQAEGVLSTAPDGAIHLVTGQSPIDKPNSQRSDHHAVATHLRWQPEDNQWQPMPDIPTPRNSATGGWVDDQLVVAGGRTRHGNLTTTEIFDLGTKMWRSGAPMPLPQAGTASVVVNDGLIVFGGEIFVPNAAVFPNVWHYSVSKNRWRAMADLPTPRHGLGAGLINGKAFVIGGATKPGGSGTSAINEVFSIS